MFSNINTKGVFTSVTWNLFKAWWQNPLPSQWPTNLKGVLNRAAGKSDKCLFLHGATATVAIETVKLWAEVSFGFLTGAVLSGPLFPLALCSLSGNSKKQAHTTHTQRHAHPHTQRKPSWGFGVALPSEETAHFKKCSPIVTDMQWLKLKFYLLNFIC